jgi:16S rRNA (cytidine1402-2'-O)-methyltransferase
MIGLSMGVSAIPGGHSVGTADPNGGGRRSKLEPGLWVVATPIGNLGDLSPRAGEVLAGADLVACEDTRVTGRLLARLERRPELVVYNDHSAPRVRPFLLERLEAGAAVALVSDAGTPCISDPGYKLVREARALGIPVRAVAGPSAFVAALSIAGLPTDRFLFLGFLPSRQSARREALGEVAGLPVTLVLYEAPGRLAALLADAAEILGAREARVARELTKLFEEVKEGLLADLARSFAALPPPKGEIVVVIGPPEHAPTPDLESEELARRLRTAAGALPPRRAAAAVAAGTGLHANDLYRLLLRLRARDAADQ